MSKETKPEEKAILTKRDILEVLAEANVESYDLSSSKRFKVLILALSYLIQKLVPDEPEQENRSAV